MPVKVYFEPVDLSTFTGKQITEIKAFVMGLSMRDQARISCVGEPG